MSFKFFDYVCSVCNKTEERMVKEKDQDEQFCCESKMERQMPAPSGSGNFFHGFMASSRKDK